MITMQTFIAALGVVATVVGILSSVIAYQKGVKKDSSASGKFEGVIASDMGYVKAGVDDIKREQKETNKTIGELTQRVTRVEESAKQAHKRIDGMEKE